MDTLFNGKQKRIEKTKKSSLILGLVVLILILFGFWFYQQIYTPLNPENKKEIVFNIEKGESLADISSNLKASGLIKSEFLFKLTAVIKRTQAKLQAGIYSLSPSMSISKILEKLNSGETIKDKITIIEGWDLRDIGWYFENRGMFQAEELFEIVGFPANDYSKNQDLPLPKDFSQQFKFLKEIRQLADKNVSLEGYLFPDTYEVKKGESLESIIKKMLKNFDQKVTEELKEEIKAQNKSLYQVLIMASLLEKEVKSCQDRQIAAGILWKRLEAGWPLQVDATISYIVGKGSLNLTKKDLKIDSPYNTYKYYGLPLGPICNPGLESIKAAINYEQSDFWYYLTTPDGKTEFSKTLEEHNIKRFKYLK